MKFKRTVSVPPGHCPEPVVEIIVHKYPLRPVRWENVKTFYFNCESDSICYTAASSTGIIRRWKPNHETSDLWGWRFKAEHGGKIMPDASSLKLPWSLAPRNCKYYGTRILDADGQEVAEFWDHSTPSHPSEREKVWFGDWTEESWAEYVSDSHWESERDYLRAKAIVDAMNATIAATSPAPVPLH